MFALVWVFFLSFSLLHWVQYLHFQQRWDLLGLRFGLWISGELLLCDGYALFAGIDLLGFLHKSVFRYWKSLLHCL